MKSIGMLSVFCAICVTVASAGVISAPEREADENLRKLALANNELAFNLHRRLASGTSKNVFFSPMSISTAFGMLFYGARGETAEELRKALGYEKADLSNNLVHQSFGRYFSEVVKSGDSSDEYVLNFANSILVDKHLKLLEEYRLNVQDLYRAVVRDVDFAKEAPQIVKDINDWVYEKTNGKIEKFLDELSPTTILALLNAAYFKGAWKTKFDPSKTRDAVFYNNGLKSEAKTVPIMVKYLELPFAHFNDFEAIELPYKGENVSMLVLLPSQLDGLQSLEKSLTPEKLEEIQSQLHRKKVMVGLPKFKLEFEKELSEEMQDIGAKRIFDSGADFSGMSSSDSGAVSEVFHKAVIEVNEEGAEAAAVTTIVMGRSGLLHFYADHPFLFAIVEKGSKSNMILFMGRVNNL